MEPFAILLSVFSTIVALFSAYVSQFKRGRIHVPPIRAYRLEPLNFSEGRAFRMYMMLTMMNSGASNIAISDLRIRVAISDENQELLLDWENECPNLHSHYQEMNFAKQPTIAPYGSQSFIYTFNSKYEAESAKLVKRVEELCDANENKMYKGLLEMRDENNRWQTLREFAFRHSGRNCVETSYNRINKF
jgi:hypothetical protein